VNSHYHHRNFDPTPKVGIYENAVDRHYLYHHTTYDRNFPPAGVHSGNTSWWGFLPSTTSLPLVIQMTEGICAHHHHLPCSKRELEAIPATTTLPLAVRVAELAIQVTAGFVPITTPSLARNASGGHPCQLPCRSFKCKLVIITTTSTTSLVQTQGDDEGLARSNARQTVTCEEEYPPPCSFKRRITTTTMLVQLQDGDDDCSNTRQMVRSTTPATSLVQIQASRGLPRSTTTTTTATPFSQHLPCLNASTTYWYM